MTPICIYHGGCADGFTALWAVWKALGINLQTHAGVYGEDPPDVTGRDVIMVDFSYKRPVLMDMAASARTILILDHHKTAKEDLAGLPLPVGLGPTGPSPADWGVIDVIAGYSPDVMADWARQCNAPSAVHAIFDMDRSGAQLAWDFFHPGKPRPALVDYVADRDLWQFKLFSSRAVNALIYSHKFDLDTWTYLEFTLSMEDGRDDLMAQGAAILRQHDKNVESLIRNTRREMWIGGHLVPVANVPHFMASDVGGSLAEGQPFSATYYDRPDARVFSLRSRDGGVDVAEIAARFGGGGHRQAAGFQAAPGWEGDAP